MTQRKFAIIGTGVVGTALAVQLDKAGYECVGVNTRSHTSYRKFSKYLNSRFLKLDEIALEADLIFITTQDNAIEKIAQSLTELTELAELEQRKEPQTWIHCSGSMRSEEMCKDPSLMIDYLSIHPLQAFACVESALTLLPGTHFGIEGNNPDSERLGEELVQILGGIPHKINPEKKTLYHAGAVVASNYLVSLAYMAVRLFGQAGIDHEDALESLLPLMLGSYKNVSQVGLPCALTGPIARGDVEVVAKHLQEMPDDIKEVYKGMGRLALELGKDRKVLNKGSYNPEALEALEQLLK